MKIMRQYVEWARNGDYPIKYDVISKIDKNRLFSDIIEWENVPDSYVEDNDWTFEENTVLFVLKLPSPVKFMDMTLFPMKSIIHRIGSIIMKFILYKIMNPIHSNIN